MTKIAVLGAGKNLISFYEQIHNEYEIIGIAWEKGAVCKKYCDKFYPISFSEKDKVLEICRKEKIDGITSFSLESALPTVIYVAQKMGLVSNSKECFKRIKNKFCQRKACEERDIVFPFYIVVDNIEQLKFRPKIPYPIIVKPVDSGGSQGINLVTEDSCLNQAILDSINYSKSGRVIIEQFIEGREFSVESISCNGQHYVLQVTDKITTGHPHFVEIEHHQPANVSVDIFEKIKKFVIEVLNALLITNSASHTEIILNNNNIYLVECGARMGGDFISSHLVRLSTGYDYVKEVIKLVTGNFTIPQISSTRFSGVYFYSKNYPQVRQYIMNCHCYPEIVESALNSEDLVEIKSNSDRSGYFIYQNDEGKFLKE